MLQSDLIRALLDEKGQYFDDSIGMLARERAKGSSSYHTALVGKLHGICENSNYATEVFLLGDVQNYDRARKALQQVCDLQDQDTSSATFGLWPYFMEETLADMKAPDYNWADFVGKGLITICSLCDNLLTPKLRRSLHQAIRNALCCSINRNVSADYTNISIMSSLCLISGGELLKDAFFFNEGKKRLKRFYEYTEFNGAFSEYNSSAYVVTAMKDIARMLALFKDAGCRAIAERLNWYAWDMLASHYNTSLGELTPPQMRAYRDIDNGALAWIIWLGTNGKYGKAPSNFSEAKNYVTLEELCFSPHCPDECLHLFEEKEKEIRQTFYKTNSIRQPGEDTTIIRELDSPDLKAYSYKNTAYSIGSFDKCDCWNQRRNVMVLWEKEKSKSFRVRGIHDGYDFCSAMVYADQNRNKILGHLGFVTDRGSFHYILDKEKNGIYKVNELGFRFELGGNCENIAITRRGNDFYIYDEGISIHLRVEKWVFNGQDAEVKLSEDRKAVILVGYEGPPVKIDTNKLGETYGVFSLTIEPDTSSSIPIISSCLSGGRIISEYGELKVQSYNYVVPYRKAIGLDGLEFTKMESQISTILEKMKDMQSDGSVNETCPISIISMDAWEWPQGVALFAMFQYYKQSGDKSVFEYLKTWFDKQLERGLPEQNINTTCPMLTLACVYEEEQNERYLPVLLTWVDGVMKRLPRTMEGGLQHIVSGVQNENQLWDDTLYMTVLFLAKMGRILNCDAYIQESIRQFMIHIKYLSDVKTGLFFHGWTFNGCHHFAKALWGRGNSWYTAGLVDYLECLEGNKGIKDFLISTLQRQVDALEACQDESGLWHTILDDSDSYLETSASCAFAYGILKAVRKGYLPARYLEIGERAVRGVMNRISSDGTVQGVSYGTPVFNTIQEYKEIPICPMPYGQSMALMMLVEAYRCRPE